MNGNISQDGIAKDLAWMKRVGIGGVQCFDAARATPQVVEHRLPYMTPEWKRAFRFAVERADALGLEFAVASSPGWSETGGPWVAPKDGMKKVVWSELKLRGGDRYTGALPSPPRTNGLFQDVRTLWEGGEAYAHDEAGYYADVAVLAVPVRDEAEIASPRSATSNGAPIEANMLDSDITTGIALPRPVNGEPGHVQFDFEHAQTVQSAVVFVENLSPLTANSSFTARLEASDDGRTWRPISQANLNSVPSTMSFAPVTAASFRLVLQAVPQNIDPSFRALSPGLDGAALMGGLTGSAPRQQRLVQFELLPQPRINAFEVKAGFAIAANYFGLDQSVGPEVEGIPLTHVLDLTAQMSSDGRLDWTPPPGRWRVLRFGYALTGRKNHAASAEATGLEVDKYDAAAVEAYLEAYLGAYRDTVGAAKIGRRGLNALVMDSTEVGPSNWTQRMPQQFERTRGYDLKRWLPALCGEIVESRQRSDEFLYDFRRTLSELHASEHYQTVARVAHAHNLTVYAESLEATRVALGDDLDMRRFADCPMGALWSYAEDAGPSPTLVADVRGAASVAHLHGKTVVSCESLTSIGHPWAHAPSDLQPMIDTIFLHGVNRPAIHTSVHQPTDQAPGLTLGVFGQNFTRHETWAEMAAPWIDYIARNSYLLQQGRNVADVAYFYGEERPLGVQAAGGYMRDVPTRHAYDFVSADAILNLLAVDQGELITAGGARYKLLYVGPAVTGMTLPVLRKLAALAEGGATIVGEAPQFALGVQENAAEFGTLVRRLWSGSAVTDVGRGRVIAGSDIEGALARLGIAADFETSAPPVAFGFVHRKLDDGDIYFVSNRTNEHQRSDARFRIEGRAPEFWRADTGRAEQASYRLDAAHVVVPLDMGPHESLFVVFRQRAHAPAVDVPKRALSRIGEIDGPWDITFQAGRGAPPAITLDRLASLSEHADPGVRYFSGVATYRHEFAAPEATGQSASLILDLGRVSELAEVFVNGRFAGAAWKAPYRVDIGPFVRPGRNRLEVRVANLWVNRLIGDQQPGAQRIAFAGIGTFTSRAPLRASGLIGPLTLFRATA